MGSDSRHGQVIRLPRRLRSGERVPRLLAPAFGQAALQEALPDRILDASANALILASLSRMQRPLLWVTDRLSRRENGRLHVPGLRTLSLSAPILHVEGSHPRDVLWAMEEGAACGGLSAVVGEIHGAPAVLDFTATKRLALRAEASGVPVWLIRSGDPGGASAARERWRVSARPSDAHPHDPGAPGKPVWQAELFRARARPPGLWEIRHDPTASDPADRFRMVSRSGDGALESAQPAKPDLAGR
jgi:protein ImuA